MSSSGQEGRKGAQITTKAPPTKSKAPPTVKSQSATTVPPHSSSKTHLRPLIIPSTSAKTPTTSVKTSTAASRPTPTTSKAPPTASKVPPASNKAPPTSTSVPPTTNKPSLSATVNRLKSDNPRKVVEALVLIRKCFIKEKTGTDRLRHYGGVEALLAIIKGTNNKQKDIALSIMGNICMDPKVQKKVHDLDGITVLGEVVKKSEDADMVNRACRTLANLAQNPECCLAVHDCEGLIAAHVNHLNKATDQNIQLTIIRALRILSDTSCHRQAVLDEEGLRAVASMLKSETSTVIKAAYQCLMVLTKKFSIDCARQIVAADAPASVIKLTEHKDKDISKAAFTLLLTDWMNHEEMRVGIGNAGGVPFFIEHLEKWQDKQKRLILANALCLSCYEVVNRVRVKDNNGLQIMLKLLHDSDFKQLHDRLISALTCFLYDDVGFEVLLKNDIVGVILIHLKRVAKIKDIPEKLHYEEDVQAVPSLTEERKGLARTALEEDCVKTDVEDKVDTNTLAPSSEGETHKAIDTKDCPSDGSNQAEIIQSTSDKNDHPSDKDKEETLKATSEESTESSDTTNENGEEKDPSKSKALPKYSIDSPTYKSVVEWQVEDYSQGPKNILDWQLYYEQASSPSSPSSFSSPSHYGPYSPLSVSSYGSYDCSPDTSPCPKIRSHSPNLVSFDAPNSPESMSLSSELCSDTVSRETSPVLPLSDYLSGQNSPTKCTSPGSPNVFSEPASPLLLSSTCPMWGEQEGVYFYSSDEDEQSDSDQQFSSLIKDSQSNKGVLKLDSLSLPSTSSSSFSRMNSDNSDTDASSTDSKQVKSIRRTPLSAKQGQKRKRDLTPEMRKKILLSVEKSTRGSTSSINLSEMLLANPHKIESEVSNEKECPPDRRDFRKHIEYCLIMLLKRISYGSDPSDYLIKTDVMATILDYVRLASKPFNKCGRILIRLTKNPKCFERLLYEMLPAIAHRKLHSSAEGPTTQAVKSQGKSDRSQQSEGKTSTPARKPTETIHRSMSACTLKETKEAARFHKEVLKHLDPPAPNVLVDNAQDALELKNTIFSNMALMADSPFGQGVIEHLLHTGTLNEKSKIAISLAFVCRSRSLLMKTFIECKGFMPLFSAMKQNKCPNLQRNALQAIFCLASSHLKEPPRPPPVPDPPRPSNTVPDITFTFDDGSSTTAQRSALAEGSEVFAAMLEGHYSESKQSTVHMPDASREAFQVVLDYFGGEDTASASELKLGVLTEAYSMAHRFMLKGLLNALAADLVEHHLTLENVEEIFSHAVLHDATWLTMRCLLYVLVNSNEDMDRGHLVFRNMLLDITADSFMDLFQ